MSSAAASAAARLNKHRATENAVLLIRRHTGVMVVLTGGFESRRVGVNSPGAAPLNSTKLDSDIDPELINSLLNTGQCQ